MKYNIICSITTILATATAVPLGVPLGNGRFVYPEYPVNKRLVVSEGEFNGKFPLGVGPELSITPITQKRTAVYPGEFDDPTKQGLFVPTGDVPVTKRSNTLIIHPSDLTSLGALGIGIGPEVPSGSLSRRTVLDLSKTGGVIPQDRIGLGPVILPKDNTLPLDGVPTRRQTFGLALDGIPTEEHKRTAEPIVLLPGMEPINPDGCSDPVCTSLKERAPEPKPEPEPIVLQPGEEPINPPGCDDPLICASLKERNAEPEPEAFVLEPGETPPASCTADIPGIVCLRFRA